MPGVRVRLFQAAEDGTRIPSVGPQFDTTDTAGHYDFCVLAASYVLHFDAEDASFPDPQEYAITRKDAGAYDELDSDADYKNDAGEVFDSGYTSGYTDAFPVGWDFIGGPIDNSTKWDVGLAPMSDHKTIGGTVWKDISVNGLYDFPDTVFAGAQVDLYMDVDPREEKYNWVRQPPTAVTNEYGQYTFTDLLPETQYMVAVRGLGTFSPSPFYDPDPTNLENNDNNAHLMASYVDPFEENEGGINGSTPGFSLPPTHPSPDTTIDLGFTCGSDAHDIVLLVDTSGSMTDEQSEEGNLTATKAGARRLVYRLMGEGGYSSTRMAVVRFAGDVQVKQPLTTTKAAVLTAIADLPTVGEGPTTHMDEGIEQAAGLFDDPDRNRVILLVSDGRPGPPMEEEENNTIAAADAAKQDGIKIVAVGIGETVNTDTLQQIATSAGYYHGLSSALHLGKSFYFRIVENICHGDAGTSDTPCEGNNAFDIDLASGVDVANGRDQRWEAKAPGQVFEPAFVVDQQPDWSILPQTSWVSADAAASGSEGVYEYRYVFPLDNPLEDPPPWAYIDLHLLADDYVTEVTLNGVDLWGSLRRAVGATRKRASHVSTSIRPDLLQSQNELFIAVSNYTDTAKTGLDVAGKITGCYTGTISYDTRIWHPASWTCNPAVWNRKDRESGNEHLPEEMKTVTGTPPDAVYCMQVRTATFHESKVVDPGASRCWLADGTNLRICYPKSTCAAGRYKFPMGEEFDLGIRNYAAVWPSSFTGFPWPLSTNPGRFQFFTDRNGIYPNQVFRNADTSYKKWPNIMERYMSRCLDTGMWGMVVPPDGGTVFQWVAHEDIDFTPFNCPPDENLGGCDRKTPTPPP